MGRVPLRNPFHRRGIGPTPPSLARRHDGTEGITFWSTFPSVVTTLGFFSGGRPRYVSREAGFPTVCSRSRSAGSVAGPFLAGLRSIRQTEYGYPPGPETMATNDVLARSSGFATPALCPLLRDTSPSTSVLPAAAAGLRGRRWSRVALDAGSRWPRPKLGRPRPVGPTTKNACNNNHRCKLHKIGNRTATKERHVRVSRHRVKVGE